MWRFESEWRQIISILPWDGLFAGQDLLPYNHTEFISQIGKYLEADIELIKDLSTSKVYLGKLPSSGISIPLRYLFLSL